MELIHFFFLQHQSLASLLNYLMRSNGDISPIEFTRMSQETEKYCKIKANIRNREITKISSILGTNVIEAMTNHRAINNTAGNFVA